MSNADRLMAQLRQRLAEPMTLRLMLADIAKVYGDGFAETLRKLIEREIEGKRR